MIVIREPISISIEIAINYNPTNVRNIRIVYIIINVAPKPIAMNRMAAITGLRIEVDANIIGAESIRHHTTIEQLRHNRNTLRIIYSNCIADGHSSTEPSKEVAKDTSVK